VVALPHAHRDRKTKVNVSSRTGSPSRRGALPAAGSALIRSTVRAPRSASVTTMPFGRHQAVDAEDPRAGRRYGPPRALVQCAGPAGRRERGLAVA
jgi:hypothetical protein